MRRPWKLSRNGPVGGSISEELSLRRPSCLELGLAFGWITMVAFGGGAPWVKRIAVDDRRWVTMTEFAELTSFAQSFPGAIFFNLAVAIGMREHGWRGAVAALTGILIPAITVACICERLEMQLDANLMIHRALGGIVAAAAGLFASTFLQISRTTWTRLGFPGLGIAALAFCGVIVFGLWLPLVVLGLLPVGVALAWRLT